MKVGIDIGGTLIKMVVDGSTDSVDLCQLIDSQPLIQFKCIKLRDKVVYKMILPRKKIDQFWSLLMRLKPYLIDSQINVTGGGAFCYRQEFEVKGYELNVEWEFNALVKGLFNLTEVKPESFYLLEGVDFKPEIFTSQICPSLIVNLGSGFSFNMIMSRKEHYMVGGSSFGGSTIIGYAARMFGINDFNVIISIFERIEAQMTDESKQHKVVHNVIEKELNQSKNDGSFLISESKINSLSIDEYRDQMIYGFMIKILHNVSDLAFVQAKSTGLDHVFFTGSFIDSNLAMQRTIARKLIELDIKYGYSVKV